MSEINSARNGCRDVFNAFLVSNAKYAGEFEIPCIEPCKEIPERMIVFSKAIANKDYEQWVHFYEDDYLFERLWNHPRKYLPILKKFQGVILPDFSLYRDMPLIMQLWNIYRSRAIGHWLQENGVKVIPNIRFGDQRTYNTCCIAIEKQSVISIGSHGNLKNRSDREIFLKGVDEIIKTLEPRVIIVYGSAPDKYFKKYKDAGIRIVQFDSDFATSHRAGV